MFSIQHLRSAAVVSALALGTVAFAANVSTDYDHNANFRGYHTFSDPFMERRIKEEMTKDLSQAGWTMVPSGGDVSITAIGGTHDQQEYNTFYDGLGGGGFGWGGWGGGWGNTSTTVEKVPVGTLMIDMYDSSTHQLIWRGKSQAELSNKGDKNIKTLDKDIDKMLNGFPPKSKG
jgi:hypothetical protein